MGEIIAFEKEVQRSSFTISAEIDDDGTWHASIDRFYHPSMPQSEVYREIAEALIPIAGGMLKEAEEIEPTKRGPLVIMIAMYQSGIIDFMSHEIDTSERVDWFSDALDALKRMVKKQWRKQQT